MNTAQGKRPPGDRRSATHASLLTLDTNHGLWHGGGHVFIRPLAMRAAAVARCHKRAVGRIRTDAPFGQGPRM